MEYLSVGIANMVETSLSKQSVLTLIDRQGLDSIISEKSIDFTDGVDESTASELAKSIGAELVIVGSYFQHGSILQIDADIINAENEEIIPNTASSVDVKALETIDVSVDLLVEKLIGLFTGEPVKNTIEGDPTAEAILEWNYPDLKYALAVDGLVLDTNKETIVLAFNHGKHKFDVYSSGFLPKLVRTEYHKLVGGYKHKATFKDGQLKIYSIEPVTQ